MDELPYPEKRVAEPGSFEGTKKQLAQLVLDQVTTYPETHDQSDYVSDCGTTACVAGWTCLFQNGGLPLFGHADDEARKALGLNVTDAQRLFHHVTEEQARMALKFLANGEKIDWAVVGHRYPSDTQFNFAFQHQETVRFWVRHRLVRL